MWKKASEFKIGERVKHTAHGTGTVHDYDPMSDNDIYVDFDVQPEGWG